MLWQQLGHHALLECLSVRTRTECQDGLILVKNGEVMFQDVPVQCSWGGVSKACGTTFIKWGSM